MKKKELEAKINQLEKSIKFLLHNSEDVTISIGREYFFTRYYINYTYDGMLKTVETHTFSYPQIIKVLKDKIIFKEGMDYYELTKHSEQIYNISEYYKEDKENNQETIAEPTEEKCECKCKKGGEK